MSNRAERRRAARRAGSGGHHHHHHGGAVTFFDDDFTVEARLGFVEHVLSHITPALRNGQSAEERAAQLSPETRVQLGKALRAFLDTTTGPESPEYQQAKDEWMDYVHALDEAECMTAIQIECDFMMVTVNMPHGATCPGDWFRGMAANGLRDLEGKRIMPPLDQLDEEDR